MLGENNTFILLLFDKKKISLIKISVMQKYIKNILVKMQFELFEK